MKDLTKLLNSIPNVKVDDPEYVRVIECLLYDYWDEFENSHEGDMKKEKSTGRIESVEWIPPVIEFIIERHEGTVNRSTRADLQSWSVDYKTKADKWGVCGRKHIYKMAA